MQEILIVVTMDCERPRSETKDNASGPVSYADSARFIEGYRRLVAERGWPVTFFVHPEVMVAHPAIFQEAEQDGACLGLHVHPWKLKKSKWNAHLGGLTAVEQREILRYAGDMFAEGLGRWPLCFRPGTFSANDNTFAVLDELGFRGGSISAPERIDRDLCAVWTGAPRDPHRTHPAFRLIPGDMDFVNMPLSVDFSEMQEVNGRRFGRDLRPDYQSADYTAIARNIVEQVMGRDPAVPIVNLLTHNDNDFTRPSDRVRQNLLRAFDAIEQAGAERGLKIKGATIENVVDLVLAAGHQPRELETVGVIHGDREAEVTPHDAGSRKA
ncbi:MAG: polysaccharide deacetylase family protein [Betaproteobacteria bacterium]|nr:polysaccharide deacetylase family protein [Betaproteobacteria bacterium]